MPGMPGGYHQFPMPQVLPGSMLIDAQDQSVVPTSASLDTQALHGQVHALQASMEAQHHGVAPDAVGAPLVHGMSSGLVTLAPAHDPMGMVAQPPPASVVDQFMHQPGLIQMHLPPQEEEQVNQQQEQQQMPEEVQEADSLDEPSGKRRKVD